MRFKNRKDAGKQLAERLEVKDPSHTVVLALPRGGVPLGIEVAKRHHLPLDIILSKKIGHPTHSEYAIGALSEHGDPIMNETSAKLLDPEWLTTELKYIRNEMARRQRTYSEVLTKHPLKNRTVILVDDGIATGLTMKAAIKSVEAQEADKIIVAVPIIPQDTYEELKDLVDSVAYVDVPDIFQGAVGAYYMSFKQVKDEEVMAMLHSLN